MFEFEYIFIEAEKLRKCEEFDEKNFHLKFKESSETFFIVQSGLPAGKVV